MDGYKGEEMKDFDLLDKLRTFDDTMDYVKYLRDQKEMDVAKHLHELWTLSKHLGTEVKRLRGKK